MQSYIYAPFRIDVGVVIFLLVCKLSSTAEMNQAQMLARSANASPSFTSGTQVPAIWTWRWVITETGERCTGMPQLGNWGEPKLPGAEAKPEALIGHREWTNKPPGHKLVIPVPFYYRIGIDMYSGYGFAFPALKSFAIFTTKGTSFTLMFFHSRLLLSREIIL